MSRSELRRLDLSIHQRVKDREVEALPSAGYEEDPPAVDARTHEEVPFYSTDRTAALNLVRWAEEEIGWTFSEEELPEEGPYRIVVELDEGGSDPVRAEGADFAEAVARATLAAADAAGLR